MRIDDQRGWGLRDLDGVGDRAERSGPAGGGIVDGDPAAERVLDRGKRAVDGDVIGAMGFRSRISTVLPRCRSCSTAACMLGVGRASPPR